VQKNLTNIKAYIFLLILLNGLNFTLAQYPTVRERVMNLPNFDDRFLHYGYFIGTNSYDFKFEYENNYYSSKNKDIEVISNTGFNVGLVGDLRINRFINLRLEPGLYYSKRDLIYPEFSQFNNQNDRFREVKSTYIHLPLLIKISAERINNFRPFILAGISTDFNLSSNHKNTDDNFSNVFRTQKQNINYELGLGFDFYLFYFKFSPSIRGIFSLQNEIIPDNTEGSPWTGHISKMFSRGFAINFTFE
tara:strand:+ start:1934 stop:2677 length:744 start_codon:yes stop_codon:yes gene_type:complete